MNNVNNYCYVTGDWCPKTIPRDLCGFTTYLFDVLFLRAKAAAALARLSHRRSVRLSVRPSVRPSHG